MSKSTNISVGPTPFFSACRKPWPRCFGSGRGPSRPFQRALPGIAVLAALKHLGLTRASKKLGLRYLRRKLHTFRLGSNQSTGVACQCLQLQCPLGAAVARGLQVIDRWNRGEEPPGKSPKSSASTRSRRRRPEPEAVRTPSSARPRPRPAGGRARRARRAQPQAATLADSPDGASRRTWWSSSSTRSATQPSRPAE